MYSGFFLVRCFFKSPATSLFTTLLAILIASLWLALNINKGRFNVKWLLFSVGAIAGMGAKQARG